MVDYLELAKEPAFEIGRDVPRSPVLDEKRPQPLVSKADDQSGRFPLPEPMYHARVHTPNL
jgi:hypothetical protein